ncbi:M20 family metallopeptidase [Jeotgalibaca caeni]|uniref:M20 family metallopeptidase n=1 Tax=Jeotgalibaca caeni TaxID=3028623 RepID=UPI00237E1A58|nr:M20 family metallopeptidase [Jeotgalibaca caeni]MDE1549844.1 M20 family metallopeptidase [Jeotgalibaca caeni]
MATLLDQLMQKLEEKKSRIIEIRRYFHENPELSFEETETASYIADFYRDKDVTIRTNVGEGHGITVDIEGGKEGPSLAIRADFDALPIQEETDLPFASKNPGVMHACGHDGHTAYMMILAESLIELKDQLPGKVRILHQPAEEVPPGGAKGMIEAGCLDGMDHVIGIHVMSLMETGTVHYHVGASQTGCATFKVKLQGTGGHGSAPHAANDTIVAAAQFVTAVQTIVSRRINPFNTATVTIGSFDGKGSANVIKDSVTLEGDVRIMDEESRAIVEEEFKKILAGVCSAFGIDYELDYKNDYPVLMNDEALTHMVVTAINEANIPEVDEVVDSGPETASEDFAYYAQERPSCFFYVGAHKEGTPYYPHHHPKFMIDEDALMISAKTMAAAVVYYLEKGVLDK